MASGDGLLDGVRVLDLSVWRPGPYATQLLAEIGADVIKVEPPGGDPMRTYPELFESLNADKRSVVLNLKEPDDRSRALDLAEGADVVIEGFRPGVVARLGVGYEQVRARNPAVVYCSLSGMGQTGPLALAPAHDLNYQAWAGALRPEGGEPREGRLPIADLSGGVFAAFAVCAALVRRHATGEGEYIDVAMSDVLATWTGAVRPRAEGVEEGAGGGVPGYGVFPTADGLHLALSVISESHFWDGLCDVLGLPDARGLGFVARMGRAGELQPRIAAAVARRDRDELVDALLAADVPAAPVLDRDGMLALPHFRDRRVSTSDPWAPAATGYPVTFTAHPARRTSPPPRPGAHDGARFGDGGDVALRPLTEGDVAAAGALLAATLGGRRQARLGEVHDVLAGHGIGAWRGDELVGLATRAGDELAALVVHPSARRRGLGGRLVEAIAADAAAGGSRELWLVTTNDDLAAMRLYQGHGFRMAELHPGGADRSRRLAPELPRTGAHGIEVHDEIVFRRALEA